MAKMVVLSDRSDLSNTDKVTDVCILTENLWVSDYPYLQRDMFNDVSRPLGRDNEERRPPRRKSRSSSRRYPEY